jgi:threonine 3-dehydrogenase
MATLITGGAGFLGLAVVRLLVANGEHRPVIFSRNPVREHLGDVADQVDILRGDLGTFSHVLHAVKQARPTAIYHLGALLSVQSEADPAAAFQTNAAGTFHVLEAARLFEVPRVIFASTGGTYGLDIADDMLRDTTLQRPQRFYGATKVFGEHLGLCYRSTYQLDFRGLRYPPIIGPGVRTPGIAQYTSWVIEACAKGHPFTIWVTPDTRVPVMYIKDAARATVQLAAAPLEQIKTVTYLIDGRKPTPSAQDLAEAVQAKLPEAQITFRPDRDIQPMLDRLLPIDDRNARQEWGWEPTYTLERMVEDFLEELRTHPERYAGSRNAL